MLPSILIHFRVHQDGILLNGLLKDEKAGPSDIVEAKYKILIHLTYHSGNH